MLAGGAPLDLFILSLADCSSLKKEQSVRSEKSVESPPNSLKPSLAQAEGMGRSPDMASCEVRPAVIHLPDMHDSSAITPSDVCLLLRADAEQCWLHREVIPVLRELEARKGPEQDEECGPALAYLEAMWSEATIRAHATDAAHGELDGTTNDADGLLTNAAASYHAAVRVLRELLATRVSTLVQPAAESDAGYRSTQPVLAEAPAGGGCAPRAA
jgi:hypothetical protein